MHGDSAQDVRAWFERRKYVSIPGPLSIPVNKSSTDVVPISRECGPAPRGGFTMSLLNVFG